MYKLLGTLAHLIGAFFVVKTFYELGEDKSMAYIYACIGFLFEVIKNHAASDLFAGKTKGIIKNIFSCILVLILVSLSLFCSIATLSGASQAGDLAHSKSLASKDSIVAINASIDDIKMSMDFNKEEIADLQEKIDYKEASKANLDKMSKKEKATAIEKIDKVIANYNYSKKLQLDEYNTSKTKLEALQAEIKVLIPQSIVINNDFFDSLASSLKISREDAKRMIKLLIAIMLEISSIYLLTLAKLEIASKKQVKETKKATFAYLRKRFNLFRFVDFSDWIENSKCKCSRTLRKLIL